jgi:hypothetical protein
MDNKDKKILNYLKNNNSISLRKFLMFYYGIYDSNILNNNITHNDVKILLPDLKRVSYDFTLENIKDVYTGAIIMVIDSLGNCVPYINPKLDVCVEYHEEFEITNNNSMDKFEEVINLENLNLYELSELAKKYKNCNRLTEYRKICRILKKKKDSSIKNYHAKKEKILLKGRYEDDKY